MTEPSVPRSAASFSGRRSKQHDTTILVVDDHVTFAEALASVLDDVPGLHASAATTVEDAQRARAEHEVDVVLLEVDLDGADGIRFARQALSEDPDLRIIAVTASQDVNRVIDAVRAGVSGCVPKDEPVQHLVSVVHGVLRGETWIPPPLLTRVIAELTSARRDAASDDQRLATLTRREKEILDFLVWGMKLDEIAERLCLSKNTLRTHAQHILRKLNVHSMLAAVALARRAEIAHL
jgi:DNA-binding NarL/FixJ family response regulator